MSAANLDDPLDESIADHFKQDPEGAAKKAKEWTQMYANNWEVNSWSLKKQYHFVFKYNSFSIREINPSLKVKI